jgi:hypothetical protein
MLCLITSKSEAIVLVDRASTWVIHEPSRYAAPMKSA